jgi:dipeptidyl aminopeptidase/acylaminoacyl peptidase
LKTDIRDTLSGDSVSIDVYTVFGWLDATHYVRLVQNEDAPEDIASVDILTGAMQVLYGEPPGSTRFSPDWQYLAVRDDSIRRIHIRDLSGNLVAEDLRGEFGEWSADGSLLLTFAGNSECGMAALVYTVGGDLLVCAPAPSYHGQADAAISPDNRYVATISTAGGPGIPYPPTDTDIYVTDLATGVERLVAADLYGDIACIDWSPDSRFLVVGHLCGV